MAKPRTSAVKAKPRRSESSEVEGSEAPKKKKKVVTVPKDDVDAVQARERARQRSGADD
jgi:hypothetical protein